MSATTVFDALRAELDWTGEITAQSVTAYLSGAEMPELVTPTSDGLGPWVATAIDLEGWERLALGLTLAASFAPETLVALYSRHPATNQRFTQFGGTGPDEAFCPTVRTLAFLLRGDDPAGTAETYVRILDSRLHKAGMITLDGGHSAHLVHGQRLLPGPATRTLLGSTARDAAIPGAALFKTDLGPDDLVLPKATQEELEVLLHWLEFGPQMARDWGLQARAAPGFVAAFTGPPGTGKTLAAALIGKRAGRDVLRVDLSQITSKWIGETEKNLSEVFDEAAFTDAILFFDEADALFGKRTETASANDRYANQEVSYLLQRIEAAPGLIILATNLRDNIDTAFLRRFQSVIYFGRPGPAERSEIWRRVLARVPGADRVNITELAETYDVTGAVITNAVVTAALLARARQQDVVSEGCLRTALRREQRKLGLKG